MVGYTQSDASYFTTWKIQPRDMSPLSSVSSENCVSSIPADKNRAEPITPRSRGSSPLPSSYVSCEYATPDAKKRARTVYLLLST